MALTWHGAEVATTMWKQTWIHVQAKTEEHKTAQKAPYCRYAQTRSCGVGHNGPGRARHPRDVSPPLPPTLSLPGWEDAHLEREIERAQWEASPPRGGPHVGNFSPAFIKKN